MAGHWYDTDGNPVYQVPYADPRKGMRDTTLSDAKKLGLYKSVTAVLDVPNKPALLRWKIEQIRKAVDSVETSASVNEEHWWKKVLEQSEKIGKESAIRGAEIHDALERYYKGETALPDKDREFIEPVIEFMNSKFKNVEWVSEASFASDRHRVGGKVDLYSPSGIVLDFKTKATSDIKKMVAYDGHHMQTAAYSYGLAENNCFSEKWFHPSNAKRYNLFISTEQPGLLNLTESINYERDIAMFEALNTYWNLTNGV